jgi:hypothetical protein
MSYVIVCLFKFSSKCGLPNYRSSISVEFLAVKMTVSCLATDGRHLGSGLVTRQNRKKWAQKCQNIILLAVTIISMGAITYCNFFVLGIWMVFIPCRLGQLDSDQEFVHYKQSSVNIPRFRSSNDVEVLFHRRQTVGCNYIVVGS